jgi:predicted acylesterase/phospholipase RssA
MVEDPKRASDESVRKADSILGGESATPQEVLDLVKKLHRNRKFGLARKVLDRCCGDRRVTGDPKLRLVFAQKRALSTYKDPDLQADAKLEQALRILQEADNLSNTGDQETLGLAGAIYKRMWELRAQEQHLEMSLAYYLRGYRQGVRSDYGYTGINAAYVLDLLADLESPEAQPIGASEGTAPQRREQARAIRDAIVTSLPSLPHDPDEAWLNQTWWFLVTLGEAYFGLDRYEEAESWLTRALALEDVPDWERESTARQLAALLRLKQQAAGRSGRQMDARAERVLSKFLGDSYAAVASVIRGKVGLALSGGGFRASFYHIGVLAKLAELDLLRHVEYLSCVSGGSILGAHFYLEVRKLLKDKTDQEITRQDYVDLVQRIAEQFLRGVERNIRTRIAAEWTTSLKMMFLPDYSRTMRAGELYEDEIYSRVADGVGAKARWLNDLKVSPKAESIEFAPKDNNWRRMAKVPILILNATTLNTGHNWQFTATWMGEPPAGIDSEVDANYRLRRMYYDQATPPNNRIRLGYAVAASACVPGIFGPLPIVNLYERMPWDGPRKIRPVVRLVDGGVHDNQGVAALLEQGCSVLLVSDASGQMEPKDFPSSGLLGVPLRANSILQARVRVSQFQDLDGRRRGGLLKGLMFVHLKKDLETTPVDWINCQDPSVPQRLDPLTSYGVQKGIQRRLAAIRTDLDSFSEAEAYSLMTSGYLMTEHALKEPILGFPVKQQERELWKFLQIEPLLRRPGDDNPLLRQLGVADKLLFKVWMLLRPLQIAAGVVGLLLLYLLGYAILTWWTKQVFRVTLGGVILAAVTTGLSVAGLGVVSKLLNYRKTIQEILIGLGMVVIGACVARLHLHVFDRLFLAQGRLGRLLKKSAGV